MKELNKGIVTKKVGMTTVITEKGAALPVTVLQGMNNCVIQKKDVARDGYNALKIAYEDTTEGKLNKPDLGQFKNVEGQYKKIFELRLANNDAYNVGDKVGLDIFTENEKVNATGITKGCGFTGTVKRFNFRISPISHGSKSHRRQGSIGAGTDPGKVWKGHTMPGHYGTNQVTVKNIKIVRVDTEKGLILVKGSVPGSNGSLVKLYN